VDSGPAWEALNKAIVAFSAKAALQRAAWLCTGQAVCSLPHESTAPAVVDSGGPSIAAGSRGTIIVSVAMGIGCATGTGNARTASAAAAPGLAAVRMDARGGPALLT